jgi:hypothetical protein
MIARKIIFLDSAGASTKSLATGTARFDYQSPIESFGGSVKIALASFSYTNFFINVEAPNNVIYYSDDPALPQKYTITIPTGSYGVSDLNDFVVSTVLQQTGLSVFSLQPNFSTGKIAVVFANVINWYVNFEANRPPILGANAQHVPVTDANVAFYTEELPNQASFNNITQLKVSTDLAQDSIDNSALSSSIIHISTPSVGVGSIQLDEPQHLLTIESSKLTQKVSNITIRILDQLDRPVTLSEDFRVSLIVI